MEYAPPLQSNLQEMPSMPQEQAPEPKQSPNWKMISLVVGGGVVLLVGAVLVFYYFFLPPSWILGQALKNSYNAQTFRSNLDVQLQLDTEAVAQELATSLPIGLTADTLPQVLHIIIEGSADRKTDGRTGEVAASIKSDDASLIAILVNYAPKTILGSIAGGSLIEALGMESLQNKWVDFSEDAGALLGNDATSDTDKLTDEQLKAQFKVLQKHNPITITSTLPQEDVNEETAYHYAFKVDEAKLKTFYTEVTAAIGKKTDIDPDELAQVLSGITGEIWISKHGKYIVKTIMHLPRNTSIPLDISLVLTFSQYNEPVAIPMRTANLTSEEFNQAVVSILAERLLGGATEKSNNVHRIAEIKQLQTALELYFADKNEYPSQQNIILTNDTLVCASIGFGTQAECVGGTIYMGRVPVDPDYPAKQYVYSGSGNSYTIDFELTTETAGLAPGLYQANQSGIELIDSDNDGLEDYREEFHGTDPNNPDSDNDGYTDGEEVENGYDPLGPGTLQ